MSNQPYQARYVVIPLKRVPENFRKQIAELFPQYQSMIEAVPEAMAFNQNSSASQRLFFILGFLMITLIFLTTAFGQYTTTFQCRSLKIV